MGSDKGKKFSEKHGADAAADPSVEAELAKRQKNGEIPCAVAFDAAANLQVEPGAVGRTADLMNLRLVKCQLGLFGYGEKKKISTPFEDRSDLDPQLEKKILDAQQDGRISCAEAWEIASALDLPKLTVGRGCETLNIRIKPCQLGAF